MGSHTVVYGDVLYARAAVAEGATMLSSKPIKSAEQLIAEQMLETTKRLQREVDLEFMKQSRRRAKLEYYAWLAVCTIVVAVVASFIVRFWGF